MSDAAHARDAERGMRLGSIPSDRQKKGRRKQGTSTSTRAVQGPAGNSSNAEGFAVQKGLKGCDVHPA